MKCKRENNLIIYEDGCLKKYLLDDRKAWELGRATPERRPEIEVHTPTVSRRHGSFQNMDGVWFYLDYNGKNGTIYNHKHLKPGINGKIRPIMLKDGDVFLFGCGGEENVTCKSVWGLFTEKGFDDDWRVEDTKGYRRLSFLCGEEETSFMDPVEGTVVDGKEGMAIYMGDRTFLIGDMSLCGE